MSAVLMVDGRPVGPCEVAGTRTARRRGLLGRDGIDGALLIDRCRNVHTFGMRFAIDVAHLRACDDNEFDVLRCSSMNRWRLGATVLRSTAVLEARQGAFAAWNVGVGSRIQIIRGGAIRR